MVSIIKGYQKSLAELGLDPHGVTRAAATNILSEASNHETFMNRIRIACGLRVGTIDDGEMTRLIYLKTRRRLQHLPAMRKDTTLVVHVGPGNTRALLFQNGRITRYTSYRMGTHRTREAVEGSHAEGSALLRVIREHAFGNLAQIRFDYSDVTIDGMVIIGYEVQSVAASLTKSGTACPLKKLAPVHRRCRRHERRGTRQTLPSRLSDGGSAAARPRNQPRHRGNPQTRRRSTSRPANTNRGCCTTCSSRANSPAPSPRKCCARRASSPNAINPTPATANTSAISAPGFFDELADLHHLTPHDALLLQVAAILHEVGTYVSPRAHHKHSEYIILNSEVFGLDRMDVTIVALVARYHRHSGPVLDHPSYAALSTDDRIRVSKLAALLRVADALERTHAQRVSQIEIRRESGKLRLRLPGLADAAVERLAMTSKADLFEQVFGLGVVIDEDN